VGQKVDVKGLHKHLGGVVSEWTLRQHAKQGKLPGCVRIGARYIFDVEIVDQLFQSENPRRQPGAADGR